MKEKLTDALGTFGVILWYIISVLYAIAPLVILHTPLWLTFILLLVMSGVPFIGELIRLVVYVWAFVVALSQPIDFFSILFFICAVLYIITTVIPLAASLFTGKDNH